MGGAWSSAARKTPVIESVRADPSAQCLFTAPLILYVKFNAETLRRSSILPAKAVWTVALEVDIAHFQSRHTILEFASAALTETVRLEVASAAFETVVARHSVDALANVAALHLTCRAGDKEVADVSLIVDVSMDSSETLHRRLYGCLPTVPGSSAPVAVPSPP
jgi:hypothetical protein